MKLGCRRVHEPQQPATWLLAANSHREYGFIINVFSFKRNLLHWHRNKHFGTHSRLLIPSHQKATRCTEFIRRLTVSFGRLGENNARRPG
ncbi:hypothetical protein Plhal304r1_c020g0070911 [Plasmopara halstedii]